MSVCTMKKLTVLAYAQDADAIVRKLMSLRCVEIHAAETGQGLVPVNTAENEARRTECEQKLSAIRRVIPILAKYTRRKSGLGRLVHRVNYEEFCNDGRSEHAWQTVLDTIKISEHMEALTAEISRNQARLISLEPWLGYDAPLNAGGSAHTEMVLGALSCKSATQDFFNALHEAGAYTEEVTLDEQSYLAITYHKSDRDSVSKTLNGQGFLALDFSDVDVTARVAFERTEEHLQELEAELIRAEEDIRDLSDALDEVEILYDIEATTLNVCLQKRKLAATKNCAVLQGWIPTQTEDAVIDALSKFECACETAAPSEDEEPPVLLRNNRFAVNFEWVVGMYSYPKYGRFDPTFVMSIFYFLSFGLMFADVGYGLILTLGCFLGVKLLNPKPGLRRMMYMFGYCGISAIIMGLLFGGWFGDFPTAVMQNLLGMSIDTSVGHFFGSGLWFNPLDNPMMFLILSMGFGFVHMVAGMVLRFIILCKDGKALEALCTIAPYWVIFAGILLMLAVGITVGLTVFIIGAVLVLLLNGYGIRNPISRLISGFGGLYGLVNYMSDLLSYSRILALALVAAVLAKVINMITMMGSTGFGGVIVMIIILLVGHVFNLAINVLGAFVHTSRLQYLEFFGKFYEDGGRPFEPAEPSEEYSESSKL
ncbi:MAG: V-type ATP synthase subunit I [Ruminococcaceae bacterium]|nr:V-type ATP synthase subunit I [Oscillospiraceae bacterium]